MRYPDLRPLLVLTALPWALGASPLAAQSVVVDQGSFAIEVHGTVVGTEEFSIRRAGILNNAAFVANAVITLEDENGVSELRPLLRARAPVGATDAYQLKVTGPAPLEINMSVAGPRFVSRFQSDRGQEEREFRARPDTRIVEAFVAHHYYFLRELAQGEWAPVICPRQRRESRYEVRAVVDEELTLGKNAVPARRVVFGVDDVERIVWFDRQGRVLRVEIPSEGYVAVRRDLVG